MLIRRNIKKHIYAMTLLPTLIISILLSGYFLCARFNDIEKNLITQGNLAIQKFSHNTRHPLLRKDKTELQELTKTSFANSSLTAIAIFDKEKKLMAYDGPNEDYPTSKTDLNATNSLSTSIFRHKNTVDFISPVYAPGKEVQTQEKATLAKKNENIIGWIAVSLPYSETALKKYQTFLALGGITLIGLLLSILFAFNLNTHLLMPIKKILRTVKKLTRGNLDARVDLDSCCELGELAKDINQMADTLEKTKAELQENVDQATSDLRETLETIEKQNIKLNIAQKEALKASKIKSEFISNMSHEIKTPMNCIIGFSQLLLDTNLSHTQKDYLITIKESSENLLALINNVLDFSKLEAGKLRLEAVPMNLRACLEDVLRMLSHKAHTKQLELTHLLYEDVPNNIIGDPLRIKQILMNLVGNAIKFTENGSVIIRVSLEEPVDDEATIRISVTDTGIGVSKEEQTNIFDAFQHANSSTYTQFGGTGLGLAITKKLIEKMNGTVSLKSEKNKGSTFWVTFTCPVIATKDSQDKNAVDFQQQKVWLFDQHTITRFSIANCLNQWNLLCDETADIDQLDAILEDENAHFNDYKLIILGMPQSMNFEGFKQKILGPIAMRCKTPILVLSNSSEPHLMEQLYSSGTSACLPKPVFHDPLLKILKKILYNTEDAKNNQNMELDGASTLPLPLANINILTVDDNPHNNNLVKTILEHFGAKVTTASDGNYAIILANKHDYDIILMDLRMPNLDGVQATKFIRKPNCRNHRKPIIAISAHITAAEKNSLFDVGFSHYLTKPIDDESILKSIQDQLKKIFHQPPQEKETKKSICDIASLSHIDLMLGKKLAGGKEKFALEMLEMLNESMPGDLAAIQNAYDKQDFSTMLDAVHRFHGAICYVGTPGLKKITETLETLLKNKKWNDIPEIFKAFIDETQHIARELKIIFVKEA